MFVAGAPRCSSAQEISIVGFAAFSALADGDAVEGELDNMAVDASWRRLGIGHKLLTSGFAWMSTPAGFSTSIVSVAGQLPYPGVVWLEVRASNADAIAFYQHAGFAIAGRRTSYYSQPTEDAIVMRKSL